MRTCLPILAFLAVLAAPAHAQTCRKAPLPFLPGLFPTSVLSMPLEFVTDPSGGCTAWYRPPSQAARSSQPWAMVSAEANREATLGEDAGAIRSRFGPPTYTVLTMADWPVVVRSATLGEEFVAIKGSVRVVVLVKNGDGGEASRALARAAMEQILPQIPCG